MENNFFNNILYYMHQEMSGVKLDIEEYASESPYYRIWKKGHQLILDGVSEISMHVAIEYEKELLIRENNLTKDELLETILMEHIIYSVHSGKFYQIAEMAQNFAPQDIMMKYADVIGLLYGTEEEIKHASSYSIALTAPEQEVKCGGNEEEEEAFALLLRGMILQNQNALMKEKITMMNKMLQNKIPDNQIMDILSLDSDSARIIKRGLEKKRDISEILYNLSQSGKQIVEESIDYRKLDENEAKLFQLARFYGQRMIEKSNKENKKQY